MRKYIYGIFISTLFFCQTLLGQTEVDYLFTTKYERPSVTVCLLNFPDYHDLYNFKSDFENYDLDAKYNKHEIGDHAFINSPFRRDYIYNDRYKLVEKRLNELQIAKKVIEKWFAKGDSFSMDLVAQSGIYNATESDLEVSEKTRRGIITLEDAGERLVNKSYILVIDFYNLDIKDANMSRSPIIGYLYKVNWTEEKAEDFYANAWRSKSYFDNMKFDITYVTQVYVPDFELGSSTKDFIDNGIDRTLKEAARYVSDLRVRTQLISKKPIKAHVGTKEGVKLDQKFIVYERVLNHKGKIEYKLKGSIRAKSAVAINTDTTKGKQLYTSFYQDAGWRLRPGMLMEQRYETGISFSAGWANRSLQGVMFRIDYSIARWVKWSLFKIFAEIQIGSSNVQFGNGIKSYQNNSFNYAIGFSKEFVITHNIHIEPNISLVYDNTSFQLNRLEQSYITYDSLSQKGNGLATSYQQFGLQLGLRLPINLAHNFQLIPGIGYSTISFPTTGLFGARLPQNLTASEKAEMKIDDSKTDWFKNPKSDISSNQLKWELMLRLKF